jgi:hypothetical protein
MAGAAPKIGDVIVNVLVDKKPAVIDEVLKEFRAGYWRVSVEGDDGRVVVTSAGEPGKWRKEGM